MTNSAQAALSRVCTKCGEDLPIAHFYRQKRGLHGRKAECKSCANDRLIAHRCKPSAKRGLKNTQLKRNYGITIEEYESMLASQNGRCAICGTNEPAGRGFCVDHCHTTGAVRSILCHHCNAALGHLKEDLTIIKALEDYVKVHSNHVP